MIKVSVLYPNQEGKTFNMDYYLNTHMPMVAARLTPTCKGISVEQGISGGLRGTAPAYLALAHLLFDSVQAFESAFVSHASEIMADIPNYTAIEPILQVSEVKM